MNFEHLIKFIINNKHKLKNKSHVDKILNYYTKVILVNRQKLKLGTIVFEINLEPFKNGMFEPLIKIKYINQDRSQTPEAKLALVLKFFQWEWTTRNVVSLFLILFIITDSIYKFVYSWIKTHLSFLISYDLNDTTVFKIGLDNIFPACNFLNLTYVKIINTNMIDIIFDLCLHFNLIL